MPLTRSRRYCGLCLFICISLLCGYIAPVVPVARPVHAARPAAQREDDSAQPHISGAAHVQLQSTQPTGIHFLSFPTGAATTAYTPARQINTTLIRITDAGFSPSTVNVFGPTTITWRNETTTIQSLRSGAPEPTPSGNKTFLPVVTKGSPSAVAAAMHYLQELRQRVGGGTTFAATLQPGQTFAYRLTEVGQYTFHLSNAPQFTGQLALSGTALLRTSPSNGEAGVAASRETIIEFSSVLDPTSVTVNAFIAQVGAQVLNYRLNLSADRTRVTLFYEEPLPGSTRVRVTIDGNQLKDALGSAVDVDGDGIAGGNATIEFDTLSLTVIPGTKVCGRVFASELAVTASNVAVNTPLAGVTISVAGRDADLLAKTDTNGNFCLDPAPAGSFFVHIDGRTATNELPTGAYYPFVGKLWQATPGQQTNVGDAYLPLVVPGTLQPVSAAADTLITFPEAVLQGHPEFEGVMITVPANSLFNDDGSRGGKVGIAPVPPDRLPGQLPVGLEFPVVITVQTDGAENFDTPAPVCFPNLPDPTSGTKLQPGAKDALYSFNHDTGAWETVGAMTVTNDGRLVCTDPGVGIRAPGWHGNGPPPKEPPPPPPCKLNQEKVNCWQDQGVEAAICFGGAAAGMAFGLAPGVIATIGCSLKAAYDFGIKCDRIPTCAGAQAFGTQQLTPIADDPIAEQINQQAQAILQLLYPYAAQGIAIPADVQAQAESLLAQMHGAAGGDAVAYLRALQLQTEINNADLPEAGGNAPPYPVRYAAQIRLANGQPLVLRGWTQSYGQYELFTPRNGELLQVTFFDPQTQSYGAVIPKVRPDALYALPNFYLLPLTANYSDFDQDDLYDVVEFIYGSALNNPDTDGDGLGDGAEVAEGTDPLGSLLTQTGIIGSADTPGSAVDICVAQDLAILADAEAGVTVFNIFDHMNPKRVAQIDTPGNAQRVACSGGQVAVADGQGGLAILTISDGATARIVHQIDLNAAVTAVAGVGNLAYAATAGGRIVAVDLVTGAIRAESIVAEGVEDLAIQGEMLYALTQQQLYAFERHTNALSPTGATAAPGIVGAGQRPWRLFVGGNLAYSTHSNGYDTFDLTTPQQPLLLNAETSEQFGWKQLIPNGSGIGVAAVGPNSTDDGPHNISLYDLSDLQKVDQFITQFETPGLAAAVALYNGRAYVADSEAGLQVINYLAYDNQQTPPTITLATNFAPGKAEEGAALRVTAVTTDDVQVRTVEFYVDGALIATDRSFPFEARFITPRIADQPTFTLRARALDTGNNETLSPETMITLTQDATPPRVTSVTPANGTLGEAESTTVIIATFDEAIAPSTLTATAFRLFTPGADHLFGTADDVAMPGGTITMPNAVTAHLNFATGLPAARYRAVLSTSITDAADNPLLTALAWGFQLAPVIQIGAVITDVIAPATTNVYHFVASPGQQLFFDIQDYETISANWQLVDSAGAVLFDRCFCGQVGVHTLTMGGRYTLTVQGEFVTTASTYRFQLWDVPVPQHFSLTIGDQVANGQPGGGAGNIESPGYKDIYHFNAAPGQQIFFDLQDQQGVTYASWQLRDSIGTVLLDSCLGCGQIGLLTLSQGGPYTLTFGSDSVTDSGIYQFQLWDVPAPEHFTIAIGDIISDSVPAMGAGNIESPGVRDIYHFTASAGARVFFDLQNHSGIPFVGWRLTDERNTVIFDNCLGCTSGGIQSLTQGGAYTLTFGADLDPGMGTYRFQLWDVPVAQEFTINIGETVADGTPAVGAGNIESPGASDIYHFTATAGQRVEFLLENHAGIPFVDWQLIDAAGTVLFDTCLGCSQPAVQTLTIGSLYTIVVDSENTTAVGTYQFRLIAR